MENNIFAFDYEEVKNLRSAIKGHLPLVVWLTGLSGSGKSTIAKALELQLIEDGFHTSTLDGDNLRTGLNNGLGFSKEDREENLRRVAEVAKLMTDAGLIVIAAFVSPLKENRDLVKNTVGASHFMEVFIDTPLQTCEERDVKGLYQLAREGRIKDFTGINAPYEKPQHPDVHIETSIFTIEESVAVLFKKISSKTKQ